MNWTSLFGIALWALIPGFIARKKGRSFLAYYLLSFLITPLVTTIITLCLRKVKSEFTPAPTPEAIYALKSTLSGPPVNVPNSVRNDPVSPSQISAREPSRKIMYCRRCGSKLIAGSKFCSHCGNEIEEDDAQ